MEVEYDDKMELKWETDIVWINNDNVPWTEYDEICPINLESKQKKK